MEFAYRIFRLIAIKGKLLSVSLPDYRRFVGSSSPYVIDNNRTQ